MQETHEKQRRARRPSNEIDPAVAAPVNETVEPSGTLRRQVDTHVESHDGVDASASTSVETVSTRGDDRSFAPTAPNVPADAASDRKRIEDQLAALERKQAELRRALAIADHPALSEAIRLVGARAFAVERATAKMSQGLSKAEGRRKETLEKKLVVAQTKRAEIDAQIAEIETELGPLGEARQQGFRDARRTALENLTSVLAESEPIFREAGFEIVALVPELSPWIAEVRAIAEEVVARTEP